VRSASRAGVNGDKALTRAWIRATIDPGDPNVFRFRQEIVKANLVAH
jgi:hypothetical protein